MKEADDIKQEKKIEEKRCRLCGKKADEDRLCQKSNCCAECCECGGI